MYLEKAISDAEDTVSNFLDEVAESYIDNHGTASDDLYNDYPSGDSYHQENHIDKSYNLLEAAELFRELRKYKETDRGLWQGLEPEDAICCQAAFTYGAAVYEKFREIIKEINDDEEIYEIYMKDEPRKEEIKKRIEEIVNNF